MSATRITPAAPGTDPGRPKFGLTDEQWRVINTMAYRYVVDGGWLADWPGYTAVPNAPARLLFARYLARRGVLNEGRRWDG